MALRSVLTSHNSASNMKYHKLQKGGEGAGDERPRSRSCFLRRRRGAGKAVILRRLTQSKKRRLRIMRFILAAPRRVVTFYTELVRKLMTLEPAAAACYPTIAFSAQWGVPVLSHPSPSSRRSFMISSYLEQTELCNN